MFNSLYKLSVEGKDVSRYLRMLYRRGIVFNRIIKNDKKYYIVVDKLNYKKIIDIKTTYVVKIERVYGLLFIKQLISDNKVFILSFLFSMFLLFCLSNIILDIEIVHNDKELKELVMKELNNNGLKVLSIAKDYDERDLIKQKILDNNRDILEWIEIERVGVKYIVRLDKRIIKDKNEDNNICNIVASKNGIIEKIEAERGEIVKKVKDYVKKGDILISGSIHKGEDVKDNVSAKGNVYAEVWYKVKVVMPIYYYEEKKSSNRNSTININFLNHNYYIGKVYEHSDISSNILFSDSYGLFNISLLDIQEKYIKDEVNTIVNEEDAVSLAREKILSKLSNDEYIISQNKLKTTINDSTITIEVFFKVYENISSVSYYSVKGENDS